MRRISLIPIEDVAEGPAAPASRDPAEADFQRLFDLIRLVGDVPGCQARLEALQTEIAAAGRAGAELVRARAEHDAAMARERAEAERVGEALRVRELRCFSREMAAARSEEFVRSREQALDLRTGRVRAIGDSGLTQEWGSFDG